jgi:hypothetical protein
LFAVRNCRFDIFNLRGEQVCKILMVGRLEVGEGGIPIGRATLALKIIGRSMTHFVVTMPTPVFTASNFFSPKTLAASSLRACDFAARLLAS